LTFSEVIIGISESVAIHDAMGLWAENKPPHRCFSHPAEPGYQLYITGRREFAWFPIENIPNGPFKIDPVRGLTIEDVQRTDWFEVQP
jgi:hypothetical protein